MKMNELQLICNQSNCSKILKNNAFFTPCLHIFCAEHVPKENEKTCYVCNASFYSKSDCNEIDLNIKENTRSIALMGLNPNKIMENATRALNFYMTQLNHNNQSKDDSLTRAKQQNEELKKYCTSLSEKIKNNFQEEQKKVQNLQKCLDEKIKELEKQKKEVIDYQKANIQLQAQYEKYNRRGDESPIRVAYSNKRNPNFGPRYPELYKDQNFHPMYAGYQNGGMYRPPGKFVYPFKSFGPISH